MEPDGDLSALSVCCGSTFSSIGLSYLILVLKKPLYDSRALRGFVGIDLGREPVPDGDNDLQVSSFDGKVQSG